MNVVGRHATFAGAQAHSIKVWDLPVRLFHWLLVACVGVAAVTGWLLPVTWLQIHLIAGTMIGGLVLGRIVWGFTGTRYSRFRSFIFSPAATLAHVKDLVEGRVQREAGHNPLGALMVFALLGSISVLVLTGVAVLGGELKQGPMKAFISFATAATTRDIHSVVAWVLLALIGGHVAGVIFELRRTRENLAAAMVIGSKRSGFAHEAPMARPRTGVALLVLALLAVLLVPGAYALTGMAASGVAPLPKNATWEKECGACHMAFHPSLLPAQSWAAIMSNLSQHFGEDASLDAAAEKEIADYLASHSAETWDSLAANRLRSVDPARPLEITATRFWLRMHSGIAPAVFSGKAVGAKQNCSACHRDAASGMFAPQEISIPQEKTQ